MFRRGRQDRRTEGRGSTGEPEGDEIRGEGRRERDRKRQKQGEQAAGGVEDAGDGEEEEYPDNVDFEEMLEEYDEEDVYMVIELPLGYDAETISASSLTVKASIVFLHCFSILFLDVQRESSLGFVLPLLRHCIITVVLTSLEDTSDSQSEPCKWLDRSVRSLVSYREWN